jgi:hypothetical protein
MITSKITGKRYEPSEAIFLTNPLQCQRYLKLLGSEHFLDILYTSEKREDSLVFVWRRCPETAKAKRLWDNHEI